MKDNFKIEEFLKNKTFPQISTTTSGRVFGLVKEENQNQIYQLS